MKMRKEDIYMKPAMLHKMRINIVFSLKAKNMALFLSEFFEACGIVSTKYDIDYLPKDMIASDTTIYIMEEIDLNKVKVKNKSEILLIHSGNHYSNCYDRIDIKNCEKILNYLFDKWNIPNSERNELNALFHIYQKNDLWKISWLVENIQHARVHNAISAGELVKKYIEKQSQSFRNDLDKYNQNHPNENHYLHHMELYSLCREYDTEDSERCKKSSIIESVKLGNLYKYNPYEYLGIELLRGEFYKNFKRNWSIKIYESLENEYPNSEILYELEYIYKVYGKREYKQNEYLHKAYLADPTNYLSLYNAGTSFVSTIINQYNDSISTGIANNYYKNIMKCQGFYKKVLELLNRSTLEEYTEIAAIKTKAKVLINLLRLYSVITTEDNLDQSLKRLKIELENGKLFHAIFIDMSYHNPQNLEIEECVREKAMKLVYKHTDLAIEKYNKNR